MLIYAIKMFGVGKKIFFERSLLCFSIQSFKWSSAQEILIIIINVENSFAP